MGGSKGNNYEKTTLKIMFKILLLEEAIDEIQEAYNWYEEQREGLGE